MEKYLSNGNTQEDVKHYQNLLIPLNIVVCVLCLISIFTLMFVPVFRVDIAKIVADQEIAAYVKKAATKSLGNKVGSIDSNDDVSGAEEDRSLNSGEGISGEMIAAVSAAIIDPILQSLGSSDVSLNFTAVSSLKVLTGGKNALQVELSNMVTEFADGLMDVINDLFSDGKIVTAIVETSLPSIINASIDALKNNPETPEDVKDLLNDLSAEEIDQLCADLKSLQTTTTPEQFVDTFMEVAPNLMLTLIGENLSGEDLVELRAEFTQMVNESVEKIREQDPGKAFDYNLEAFLCIQLSQNLDMDEFDRMVGDMLGGREPETDDINTESNITPYADDAVSEGDVSGDGEEKSPKIYTSFADIMDGISNTQIDIDAVIAAAVNKAMAVLGDDMSMLTTGYGLLFAFIAIFMVLWFILFLFSLIHIFTKNKRFMMWYVKLLCWIPGMIWLALTLASIPAVMSPLVGALSMELPVGVITSVIGGMSSWGTGISYICYWILWIVSIFWAFPIKIKIRRLNKSAKYEQNM